MYEIELQIPKASLQGYVNSIPEAKKAGLTRIAEAAQNIAERKVGRIRRRKVPTKREVALYRQKKRRRGKRKLRQIKASDDPAWNPTGNLAKAVEAAPQFEGDDIVKLVADLPYAESREGLGVTWTPKEPALGIVRKDPFFSETKEVIEPQANDLFADGWNSVMD